MEYQVTLPSLGDDDDAVTSGTVSAWLVEEDAAVNEGDDLLELASDKAAFIVPAPRGGRLKQRAVQEGEEVKVGDVLCLLEVEGEQAAESA